MQKEIEEALLKQLEQMFNRQDDIELAILIGSRAKGEATTESDWDIAIRWINSIEPILRLNKTEKLRRTLAKQLKQPEKKIDLIDMSNANLAMSEIIAEEGVVIKGEESLVWAHFLQRTWRELEDFYWDKLYAARIISG